MFKLLQHLTLVNGTDLLTPTFLTSIGAHLRSLDAHEWTHARWEEDRLRPTFSVEVRKYIGLHCTRLSSLSIDVPFSDDPVCMSRKLMNWNLT